MTGADVRDEVYAALRASADLVPVGPLPPAATPAERAVWWSQHAESEEVAEQALRRLHAWAVDAEQHPVLTWAIGDAVEARRRNAEQCRGDAARAREER